MSQLAPDRPHSPEDDEPTPVPRVQAPLPAPVARSPASPAGATAPTRDEPTGDQLLAALPMPAVVVDAAGTVRHANDLADLAWRMTASPGSEDSVVDLPLARLLPLEPGTLTPGPADRGPRRLRVSHVGRDLDVVVTLVREGAHPLQLVTLTDVTDAVATERVREADTRDRAAVHRVEAGVAAATTELEAARTAIERVREEFGWAYGSYWRIDEADRTLKFTLESGDAGPEFREVTRRSSFAEGVGLSGRAWRSRDLFFTPDLGEMTDCVRAPVAQRVGVKSGVCSRSWSTATSSAPWTSSPPRPSRPRPSASRRCATSGVSSPPRWSGSLATTPRRPPRPTSPRRSSRCSRSCAPPPPAT